MKGSITNEKIDLSQHQNSKENGQVIHMLNTQSNFLVSDVGLSSLPPEVESLILWNKMGKKFYYLKTLRETDSYGYFLNSAGLDEKNVEEMLSIYNERREARQQHFSNLPAVLVVRNKANALQVKSEKNCDVDQQMHSRHIEMLSISVGCIKEDVVKRDEGWFWWFGTGWVDIWIWTSNLLDYIVPPDLFCTSSRSHKSNNLE